jgi:hypothetical protein
MVVQLRKSITTFNLKIPKLETQIPIPFSGTDEDKMNFFKLKTINENDKDFFTKLLIKSFEKRINKNFQDYLEQDNEFYAQALETEKKFFALYPRKSYAKTIIRMEQPIEQFKSRLYRDIVDYFADLNLNSMSRILTYLIEKQLKKDIKRDEKREQLPTQNKENI